jgi:hypothetical protein
MPPNPSVIELEGVLSEWIRWFRTRQAITWTYRAILMGMGVAVGISLLAFTLPEISWELLRGEFLGLTLALMAIFAGAAFTAALLWPMHRLKAARYFDRKFELRERVSTALELAELGRDEFSDSEIVTQQSLDALAQARQVQPRARLPVRLSRQDLLAGAFILGALISVWFWGEPYFERALQQRAFQTAITEEIEQIESARERLQAEMVLDPERRDELEQPLQQALQGLENSRNMEQAVSVLSSTRQSLGDLSDPRALQAGEQLRRTGSDLARQEGSPLNTFGESLAGGDFTRAAGELASIDPGSLDAEEREALLEQLEETAAALEESVPNLAGQLREAAAALRENDLQSAQQALEGAAQDLLETGQQILQSELARQVAENIGQGQQRVIQAGRDAAGSQGQPAGGSETGDPGDGQLAGQGQAPGSGNEGGISSGAGQGVTSGADQEGSESGSGPISQDNAPGEGGVLPYEQIFAPQRLGEGQGGDLVTLPRSDQIGDQVTGEGVVSPGEPGESRVPYDQALPFYERIYREAMENPQLPVYLRPIVRDYFSYLEP